MNNADVAWMLMSTALVLLMTPALAFFYGGLVRSKNALNTMMMSFISLGFAGVAWALLGYSLAFAPGTSLVGEPELQPAAWRDAGPAGHDSPCAVHGVPGHVRGDHGGADLGRDRRAHALRRLHRVHHALGRRRLRAGRALGLGRRLAGDDGRARLRRRHRRARQRGRGGAGRLDRDRAAHRPWPAGDASAQRARSCCSARACSGSAGSASMPAARSAPTASPAWRLPTPCSPRWARSWSGRCSTSFARDA